MSRERRDALPASELNAVSMARLREEEFSGRERSRAITGTIEAFAASGWILCVALSGLAATALGVLIALVAGLVALFAALVGAAACEPGSRGQPPPARRAALSLAVRWRLAALVAYGSLAVALGSSLAFGMGSGASVELVVLGGTALPVAARLVVLARGYRRARAAQIDLEAEG